MRWKGSSEHRIGGLIAQAVEVDGEQQGEIRRDQANVGGLSV